MSGGVEASVIPRKYVKTQASQPSSAVQGDLWFDTDTNVLYSYNGSDWDTVTLNLSYIDAQQLVQNIDILTALAHSSATPSDYDTIYMDIFSDSNGYSNTIDTGNTDATFSSNKYTTGTATETTTIQNETSVAHALSSTGTLSQSTTKGWGFKSLREGYKLYKITKASNCTCATAIISANANLSSPLGTANFVGDVATFSSPVALTNGTKYFIGGTFNGTHVKFGTTNLPMTSVGSDSTWRITSGINDGNEETNMSNREVYNFVSATIGTNSTTSVDAITKYVQTNTITLDGDITGYQLYAKNTANLTGSLVNYQISFDNGSTWTTAKDLNSKHANSATGTSIKLKIKLYATNSVGAYAEASNYGLLVWY